MNLFFNFIGGKRFFYIYYILVNFYSSLLSPHLHLPRQGEVIHCIDRVEKLFLNKIYS